MRYLVRSGSAKQVLFACCGPVLPGKWRRGIVGLTGPMRNGCAIFSSWQTTRGYRSYPGCRCGIWRALFSFLRVRQLSEDWQRLYGFRPLLLETLVDTQFRGTNYQAANWIYLGQTRGRGRMDQQHEDHGRSVKRIYVYPSLSRRRRLAPGSLCLRAMIRLPIKTSKA